MSPEAMAESPSFEDNALFARHQRLDLLLRILVAPEIPFKVALSLIHKNFDTPNLTVRELYRLLSSLSILLRARRQSDEAKLLRDDVPDKTLQHLKSRCGDTSVMESLFGPPVSKRVRLDAKARDSALQAWLPDERRIRMTAHASWEYCESTAPLRNAKCVRASTLMIENGSDLSPDDFLFGEGRHHSTWERLLHLTENEYSVIRNAAVDAICELSLASQVDVARAVDCLIDVLNDEMESVRVNALRSLHNIALIEKPSLAEIHIRSLEVVLQDGDVDVRRAAHRLFRVLHYPSSEALSHMVNGLLDNMRRFPEDAASVYRCLWEMAALHPQMATQLTPGLLGIDPRFLPVEKPMESTEDYGKIIFVLSGNKACKPDTRPVLPAYVERYGLLVYAKLSDNPYFADCEELESLNSYRCQQADQKQRHP